MILDNLIHDLGVAGVILGPFAVLGLIWVQVAMLSKIKPDA